VSAGRSCRAGQEHAEQPAVGDGPAAGDGQPLAARPAAQGSRHPIPDQPGAKAGELVARVPAGQHVKHGLKHRAGEPGERRRAPDGLLQLGDVPVVHRRHRDDLLGEHVEGVARDAQLLDLAVPHSLRHHGRLDQVTLVLREDHAAGDVADMVAGPAGALQSAGHRRRRLDLDDEVHRAHVDAKLKTGGGHHGGEPAGLQCLLDLAPLLPGDRAVVRAGNLGRGARRRSCLGHQLSWRARRGASAVGWLLRQRRCPVRGEFVQPAAEPFGQAAGVREDDRRLVRLDQVEHPFLDVRPD
jgi:hypothetical protein